MIPWWYTALGAEEKASLNQAFDEKKFSLGSYTERAEALFAHQLDVPYAVMTNSGSSALLLALLALDLNPGDEVIVPALTWIATAQAAAMLKCKVILCDAEENAPILDINHLKGIVTSKTKVIIPVHLNGRDCHIQHIKKIAEASGAYVVEDACKALFSQKDGRFLGTFGEMGCYSLGMISPISIGYGGLIVTKNKALHQKLRMIRDHGVQRYPETYKYLGYNLKISDLLAALAIPQLERSDQKIRHLQKIHKAYLEGVHSPFVQILQAGSVPIYAEARSPYREELIAYLLENKIQVSRYHLPICQAEYLEPIAEYPHANRLTSECFILPSGPSQKMEDIHCVIEKLNLFKPARKEANERDYSLCN